MRKKRLKFDINGSIHMSNASRQPNPKGPTHQPGAHSSAAVPALAGGGPAIGPELLHFRAPGLSLPRAGKATQALRPGRRCQSGLHRQAFARSRTTTPHLRRFDRIDLERDRQPCLVGGTTPGRGSWLSRRPVSHEPSTWNLTSTDCCRTSWFKPTNCSRRTGTGRLLQARSPQTARRW
jgi:hypothetical protein